MLSSPSSSYFLFNTPLMVTPYFSYNWKTKEKSDIKRGKCRQFDMQDGFNPQQDFSIRSTWPCRCDSLKVLRPKIHHLSNTLCAHLLNFSPILQHCIKKINYHRQQTVQKPIQSTQTLSNNKYYILLTNSFTLTPYPDRFLCGYSFNILLITKISQFAENNLLA